MAEAIFHFNQKALIMNEHNEILLVSSRSRRNPTVLLHDLPGGRVNNGEEDLSAALKREMREELQLDIVVHDILTTSLAPLSENHKRRSVLAIYHCSIVSGDPVPDNEIVDYKWVPIDTITKLPNTRYTQETIEKIKRKLAL